MFYLFLVFPEDFCYLKVGKTCKTQQINEKKTNNTNHKQLKQNLNWKNIKNNNHEFIKKLLFVVEFPDSLLNYDSCVYHVQSW